MPKGATHEFRKAIHAGICSRTEAVRIKLVDLVDNTYTTVAGCADVTETHLAALTGSLDLSSSGIDSLKAGDFSHLPNLTRLDLSRNQLDTLPEGVFAGLTSLEYLKLSYNQLHVLPVGLFSGLANLIVLDLSRNQLDTLPEDVFAGLASLKDLDLWFNQLRTLPAGIFTGLASLQDLDLEENKLHTLPAGVFSGLRLRFLGLEGNELRTMPAGVFANLDVTLTLDLSHNYLHTLPTGIFTGLANLYFLDLSNNRLDKLPAGVFSGLISLGSLWIDANPGAPFVFTMIPKRIPGTNKVVATVASGAPFSMSTTIGETGATAVFPVTISPGRIESDEIVIASLGQGATFTMGVPPAVPMSLSFSGLKTAVCGLETFSEDNIVLDQVTEVNVTEGVGQLTVSWEVVCGASDYRIQWKSGSEQYGSARQKVVSGTAYTITSLNAGTVYTVRVIALRNHVADGMPSSEVSGTTSPPPSTTPNAPQNLQAIAGSAQVTLHWDAPGYDGGADITGYRIEVSSDGGTGWSDRVANTGNANTTYSHTGLAPGSTRYYRVSAINSAGAGNASNVASATTDAQVTPPTGTTSEAPQNLQAIAGSAQVTLHWDAPGYDGGADIIGYEYRQKESGGAFGNYTDIPESGPGETNARSYTVTGLTNGLEYVFHMRAVNEHGGGLPEEVTVTLPSRVHTESEELPTEVALLGNYPNPFNPETTIHYALPQTSPVQFVVYDMLGHEVVVLIDGIQPQGRHTVRFKAGGLPTGTYVYRLTAGAKTLTRTMTLVR